MICFGEAREIKLPEKMRLQCFRKRVSVREVDILATRTLSWCSWRREALRLPTPHRLAVPFLEDQSRSYQRSRPAL